MPSFEYKDDLHDHMPSDWHEKLDGFMESLRERLDETDRPLFEEPAEYDEAIDEHII